MKIKIGVVGCGSMGKNHIRVLKNLTDLYDLVGIYDIDKEVAVETAAFYHTRVFTQLDELINCSETISIVVPSKLHHDYCERCISAGKQFMVEKPMALNSEEAIAINNLAKEKSIHFMVGHIERFNPVTVELKKILQNEEIISFDFHRMSPFDKRVTDTDVIADLMIHDIDIMLSLIPAKIEAVKSIGSRLYSDQYDYVQALITFEDGKNVSLTASRITESKVRTLHINTKGAFITVDYINRSIDIARRTHYSLDVGYHTTYKQENVVEKVFVPIREPLVAEYEHFAVSILNGISPETDGDAGVAALVVCDAIRDNM